MNPKLSPKNRKQLQAKLAAVLSDELQCLSGEFRGILLDDLISAFQNRVEVLSRVQQSSELSFQTNDCIALEAE
jgi:hypothetical protein